jgi:hypothetical protein
MESPHMHDAVNCTTPLIYTSRSATASIRSASRRRPQLRCSDARLPDRTATLVSRSPPPPFPGAASPSKETAGAPSMPINGNSRPILCVATADRGAPDGYHLAQSRKPRAFKDPLLLSTRFPSPLSNLPPRVWPPAADASDCRRRMRLYRLLLPGRTTPSSTAWSPTAGCIKLQSVAWRPISGQLAPPPSEQGRLLIPINISPYWFVFSDLIRVTDRT